MINIPAYVLGKEVYKNSDFSKVTFEYGNENPYQAYWAKKLFGEDSISLEVTQLDSSNGNKIEDICKNLRKNQQKSANRSVTEISEIIKKVGEEMKEDKEFGETEKLLSVLYGRAPEVVELETKMLTDGMIYNEHLIDAQTGGFEKLEERKPVGLVYDVLAGNAAIVPIQITYSKLCRNGDFVKTASGDPIMTIEVARRLGKEDRDIGESLAVVYFPGEAENLHNSIVSEADKSVVYGGIESVEAIENLSKKYGKEFVDHGPRRAFWYIGENSGEVGSRIVQDVIPFEQVSCISPYIGYIADGNNIEEIAKQILTANVEYSKQFLPTPNWQEVHKKEIYWGEKGAEIYNPMQVLKEQGKPIRERKDNYSRVVVLPRDLDIKEVEESLLKDSTYRFIFLKPVKDEEEVVDYLGGTELRNYISRVGIENGESLKKYVSENMPKASACDLGKVCYIAPNEKHDGYYDLLEISKE